MGQANMSLKFLLRAVVRELNRQGAMKDFWDGWHLDRVAFILRT